VSVGVNTSVGRWVGVNVSVGRLIGVNVSVGRWVSVNALVGQSIGVPLTITPPSELHRPDAMVSGGMGRKGMEPKAKARMRRGAAGFLA